MKCCGGCLFYINGTCDMGMKHRPLASDSCHRWADRTPWTEVELQPPATGWGDTYTPIAAPHNADADIARGNAIIDEAASATGVARDAIVRRRAGRPPSGAADAFHARTLAAVWLRQSGIRLDVIAFVLQVSNLRFVFNRSRVARARERFGVDVWEAPRRQRGRPPKSLSSSATPPPLDADGRSQTARS
mgnify:CR=1 FL=1|jgi:hypothetical protein